MSSFRSKVLSLYRNLIRESKKFNSYSYRTYTLEKVKYEFRENRNVTDAVKLSQLIKKAEDNLQMIKRQQERSELQSEVFGTAPVNQAAYREIETQKAYGKSAFNFYKKKDFWHERKDVTLCQNMHLACFQYKHQLEKKKALVEKEKKWLHVEPKMKAKEIFAKAAERA